MNNLQTLSEISLSDNEEEIASRYNNCTSKIKAYLNLDHNDIYRIGKLMMHASILFVLLVLWILHLKKFRPSVLIVTPTKEDNFQNSNHFDVYKSQPASEKVLQLPIIIDSVNFECKKKTL